MNLSILQFLGLYLLSGIGFFFFGMMVSNRFWKRAYKEAKTIAWRKGWDAGFGFVNRIEDVRTDRISSVKVFGRKDKDDDQPRG